MTVAEVIVGALLLIGLIVLGVGAVSHNLSRMD
jgi:hypothetical protein